MKKLNIATGAAACAVVAVGVVATIYSPLFAQNGNLQTPAVEIAIRDSFEVPAADAQTTAIVEAATAFLATLTEEQRTAAVFAFTDNTQRSNWSNFPDGPVQRAGVMRGNLDDAQNAALDALLAEFMSEAGTRNIALQLAAEETMADESGGANFGSAFYYAAFLGEPSATTPWMFQFGGHHLAINVTVNGPDLSFAPMLTGGEPLKITYDGQDVFITEEETLAAQALLDSLDETQKATAIIADTPINLLLGPGEFGSVLAPEGIGASDLSAEQKDLLLSVVEARLGFVNEDDFAAKMAEVQQNIDDTYFGWWGPAGTPGAAYFRVTGPTVVLEYAPQDQDGDPTDHAHNMYRDPTNDYGIKWIAE